MKRKIVNQSLPLISLMLLFLVSACSSEKNFSAPEPIKDTTPPSIDSFLPDEATSTRFEVDSEVEIVFSERMNIESLLTEGGIKFFSGKKDLVADSSEDQESEVELKPRNASITFSEVPVTSQELITGKDIQIPATKVTLRHESGRFALNTAYTVLIEAPARDLVEDDTETAEDDRNYIEGSNPIDFITQSGNWKSTKYVPNIAVSKDIDLNDIALINSVNQFNPKVISNKYGDTFALWRQEGDIPGVNQLWISRYLTNEQKWSLLDASQNVCLSGQPNQCANAERVNNIDNTNTIEFNASVNDEGQIAVVWSQPSQPGGFISIWANLFNGSEWLNPVEISSSGFSQTGDADSPQVGIDSQGNVVSIWRENVGATTRIKSNLFKVGANGDMDSGVWVEAPAFIDDSTSTYAESPVLAINSSGLALATWSQLKSDNLRIFSNRLRLNISDDWQTPIQIDEIDASSPEYGVGNSTQPQVAIDTNGDALAIWLKYDGLRNNVWYNRFTGNWGVKARRLEGDRTGDANYPVIQISKDNKALAVWTQKNSTGNLTQLKTRFFEAATGWESEVNIISENIIEKPIARFDREGNAHLIWQNAVSSGALKTSYYSKISDSWSQASQLADNSNSASIAAMFEDGRFLSVWEETDGFNYRLNFTTFTD